MNKMKEKLETIFNKSHQEPGLLFLYIEQNHLDLEKYLKKEVSSDQSKNLILYCYVELLKNAPIKASYYLNQLQQENETSVYTKALNAFIFNNMRRYESAYFELYKLYKEFTSSYFFILKLLVLCKENGWIDRGIALYNEVKSTPFQANQYVQIMQYGAYFNYINLEFQESIKILKKQVRIIIKYNLKTDRKKISFDPKIGFQSLKDILSLLESSSIQAFPTAGTLLGLHRENNLLSFDKDIDIAVLSKDDFEMANILLDKNPRYLKNSSLPPFNSYISFYDLKVNVTIDILLFKQKTEYFEYGWFLPKRYKEQNRILHFTPFTLIKKRFHGREFSIPSNTELYLNEMYGNWKVPDPNYYSVLCNNLTKRTLLTDAFSYFEITKNLIIQNYKKVTVILNSLKEYGYNDPLFKEVESYIQKQKKHS